VSDRERESVFERLRTTTEGLVGQVSSELMKSPAFTKALQQALRGKEALDRAAGRALKQANIPTRTEFARALRRIEALESELETLRAAKAKPRRPAARKKKTTG
jgi:hypothetical protein